MCFAGLRPLNILRSFDTVLLSCARLLQSRLTGKDLGGEKGHYKFSKQPKWCCFCEDGVIVLLSLGQLNPRALLLSSLTRKRTNVGTADTVK